MHKRGMAAVLPPPQDAVVETKCESSFSRGGGVCIDLGPLGRGKEQTVVDETALIPSQENKSKNPPIHAVIVRASFTL